MWMLPDPGARALREALRQRKTTVSEIMHYAGIDRVAERISPYLKALQ